VYFAKYSHVSAHKILGYHIHHSSLYI